MKSKDILEFEQLLGHQFSRGELLEQAFTHSSHAREKESARTLNERRSPDQLPDRLPDRLPDNEQLEFLGDAVLALTVSEELFRKFPDFREGDLSKLRAHLVSEKHLTRAAQQLEIGHYLLLGRGEEKSGGRTKAALLADALEAVLGALYLDAGLEECRKAILRFVISPELERLEQEGSSLPLTDFKSTLQEKLQAAGLPQPSYVLAKEQGPEHRKTFTVEVWLKRQIGSEEMLVGRAEGSTKKNAEQEAARQALGSLTSLSPGINAAVPAKRGF